MTTIVHHLSMLSVSCDSVTEQPIFRVKMSKTTTYMLIENLNNFVENSHVCDTSLQDVYYRLDVLFNIAFRGEGYDCIPKHINRVVGTRCSQTTIGRCWNGY